MGIWLPAEETGMKIVPFMEGQPPSLGIVGLVVGLGDEVVEDDGVGGDGFSRAGGGVIVGSVGEGGDEDVCSVLGGVSDEVFSCLKGIAYLDLEFFTARLPPTPHAIAVTMIREIIIQNHKTGRPRIFFWCL